MSVRKVLPALAALATPGSPTQVWIMGIVNITPDSFSGDGILSKGARPDLNDQVKLVYQCFERGADIVDIGGESTRPGAHAVSTDQEWARIAPLLHRLKNNNFPTIISVDTRKAEVARRALLEGADMINDISCAQDPGMFNVMMQSGKPYVLTHNRPAQTVVYNTREPQQTPNDAGTPSRDQPGIKALYPEERDRTPEGFIRNVFKTFRSMIARAEDTGINRSNLILDPGFGFAKTYEQNFMLFSQIGRLIKVFNLPVLAGVSRKSFIARAVEQPESSIVGGTLAACLHAIDEGATIIRVHDVAELSAAIAVRQAIRAQPGSLAAASVNSDI